MLAQRVVSEAEYADWSKRYHAAFTSQEQRDEKLDLVAEEIEKDLVLLGATAIEDKLQVGVPECIARLVRANIQIWVLTGMNRRGGHVTTD